MPRIGKQPISIPNDVEVKINEQNVIVKGAKGQLQREFHRRIIFENKDQVINVTVRKPEEKRSRELWGTSRMLLFNMITGVTQGFSKQLEINGVGYKAVIAGKKLTLLVGYSHPVDIEVPDGLEVTVQKNIITVSGIDKQAVGQLAAQIRQVRKPEPYKGKGIKYIDEVIRRKAGKVVKAAGA